MTVEQMRRGIARLNDRIAELRAFDVAAMITEAPLEIAFFCTPPLARGSVCNALSL